MPISPVISGGKPTQLTIVPMESVKDPEQDPEFRRCRLSTQKIALVTALIFLHGMTFFSNNAGLSMIQSGRSSNPLHHPSAMALQKRTLDSMKPSDAPMTRIERTSDFSKPFSLEQKGSLSGFVQEGCECPNRTDWAFKLEESVRRYWSRFARCLLSNQELFFRNCTLTAVKCAGPLSRIAPSLCFPHEESQRRNLTDIELLIQGLAEQSKCVEMTEEVNKLKLDEADNKHMAEEAAKALNEVQIVKLDKDAKQRRIEEAVQKLEETKTSNQKKSKLIALYRRAIGYELNEKMKGFLRSALSHFPCN